jgi:hypothetical protein
VLAEFLDERSAADITKYASNVKRRMILKQVEFVMASLMEIGGYLNDKKSKAYFCTVAKERLGDKITVRDLSAITGLSASGVQYHTSKTNQNE